MSGNFSRYSHQRGKLYSRVRQVQGAMVTDADLCEASEVLAGLADGMGALAFGTGIPEPGGILDYDVALGPPDIVTPARLLPGRVVAGGLWGELRATATPGPGPLDLLPLQADFLGAEAVPDDGDYLLFVDIWDRHVGPVEDARLTEPAFLGAETAVRARRMAQAKLMAAGAFSADDQALVEESLPRFGGFRLTGAILTGETLSPDPCDPCGTEIEGSTESGNALLRLEVHDSPFAVPVREGLVAHAEAPADRRVLLKFSKDNGSLEVPGADVARITDDPALVDFVFEIADVDADQRLGLATRPALDRRAEIVDMTELASRDPLTLEGRIIRVWDGAATIDLAQPTLAPQAVGANGIEGGIATAGDWVLTLRLLDVELTLTATPTGTGVPFILPGDAWAVEIREFADAAGERVAFQPEPVEVLHHYAFVGRIGGRDFVAEDALSDARSRAVQPLSALEAQFVAWSNHHHPTVETNNVQGAIDLLWARDVGGEACLCTYCLRPDGDLARDLERIVEELRGLAAGSPGRRLDGAQICLPRGVWRLERSVSLDGLGHVVLQGAGREASEITLAPEATLSINRNAAATIRDIAFVSEDKSGVTPVSFTTNDAVEVSRCLFAASAAPYDAQRVSALCDITSDNGAPDPTIHVRDTLFVVPVNRAGLRVTGGGLQVIEGNQMNGPVVPQKGFGVSVVAEVLGLVAYVEAPRDVTFGAASGFYEVPGVAGQALDLTAFPVGERNAVMEFVTASTRLIAEEPPRSAEAWSDFTARATLSADALRSGEVVAPPAAPRPPRGGTPTTPPRGAAVTVPRGGLTAVRGGAARPTRRTAIGATAGAIATVPSRAIRPGSLAGLELDRPRVPEIDDFVLPELADDLWIDFDDRIDDLVANVVTGSYRRTFGMILNIWPRADLAIRANRFDWVHSAILVTGTYAQTAGFVMPLVGQVEIAGTLVRRAPHKGQSGAVLGDLRYPAAITCTDAGNLVLRDNAIHQNVTTESQAEDYVGGYLIGNKSISGGDEGFAGIEVRGAIGPVLQAVGNSASYMISAVYVAGVPAWTLNPSDGPDQRNTVWTFRRNSVLPVFSRAAGVEFNRPAGANLTALDTVRIIPLRQGDSAVEDDNHPPILENR